tara:strand:- start:96 stop:284 length:189 start_codon:yes stop_codon:yes gene_type:complete
MNLSNWIMNFLLMLSAYGTPLSPSDDVWEFDFNGNGFIDVFDMMDMLSMQPSVDKFGLYEER